jgi:hypothetical protein
VSAQVTRVARGAGGANVAWNSRQAACVYPTFMAPPEWVGVAISIGKVQANIRHNVDNTDKYAQPPAVE